MLIASAESDAVEAYKQRLVRLGAPTAGEPCPNHDSDRHMLLNI
jgi:hypothetical protein